MSGASGSGRARWRGLRARRLLGTWARRCRSGSLRVTLGTRILVVLVALASVSTVLTVVLVETSLTADLRRAAHARLLHAADSVSQWLDERLAAQAMRYRAAAVSPQFLANVETGHAPTLARFAADLRPVHGAAAIAFVDADGELLATDGPAPLARAARDALTAAPDGRTTVLFAWHGTPCTAASVPIGDADRRLGSLLSVERLRAEELAAWSGRCRADVRLGPPTRADDLSLPVRAIGAELELRVATSFAAEDEALAHSRENVLYGGMLGLALALGASLVLARSLVRPIHAIRRAAQEIAAGRFDGRLDPHRNDEVGDLAQSFNLMLDNLQRNIDERAQADDRVRHLAFHDGLTGLPNRRLFRQRLAAALEHTRADGGRRLAVLSLDLDRFKGVNDSLGHSAGDALLLEVACRLNACVDALDAPGELTLARLGGDEFALLVGDVTGRDQVAAVAERLLTSLRAPVDILDEDVSVGASIGIAMAPDDGHDVETLLRDSDLAMSHAKEIGGQGFAFFADSMEEIANQRLALEGRMRRALENGEFVVHYQPKLDLAADRIVGVEALVRWQEPGGGLVPPDEFLPMAEETGAIVPIGEWVLRTAAAQSLAWQLEGLPARVAVNVSARQLQHRDDFVETVRTVLDETGVDPSQLELEITESSMLKDEAATVALLERVRELGVGLALDDFGTGYSSFGYLRRLPIDTLKVDRSFVEEADRDPEDAALVGAILAMARVLDLRVVVEGVETRKQRRFLEHLGCDEIQGYLISKPVPADEATALLRRQMRRRRRAPSRPRAPADTLSET